jgi:hypothetical protein
VKKHSLQSRSRSARTARPFRESTRSDPSHPIDPSIHPPLHPSICPSFHLSTLPPFHPSILPFKVQDECTVHPTLPRSPPRPAVTTHVAGPDPPRWRLAQVIAGLLRPGLSFQHRNWRGSTRSVLQRLGVPGVGPWELEGTGLGLARRLSLGAEGV